MGGWGRDVDYKPQLKCTHAQREKEGNDGPRQRELVNFITIQYNNTLLILKKEIQLSAFDKS